MDTKSIKYLEELIGKSPDGDKKEELQEILFWNNYGRELYLYTKERRVISFTQADNKFEVIYKNVYGLA